ncbi:hypothetical protein LOTGIDRAFT_156773 [Lottia gigantea]|uniref:BZIP domain-containing protein n=1 Tax=Lottia gigantea TaxID=225164 RepID=V4CKN9_LOTGI|nr:hypothetical protein LOTGIDRAFT_156773 [Lottia gigantea]ESP02825.1 hypothetical protein LOTGIDRAFT_156773 [Lottia gigantea]
MDEAIDVENIETILVDMDTAAIISPPVNLIKVALDSSERSSPIDDIEFLKDFISDNDEYYKDDVSFADRFLDDESLELSEYLSQNNGTLNRNKDGRVVSDLELLNRQQQQIHSVEQIQNITGRYDPSMSKNAIAARENRLKKKQYLAHLEKTVKKLSVENKSLKTAELLKDGEISKLKTEVKYLSNVLANQSTLSSLIQNIKKTPGVKFKYPIDENLLVSNEDRMKTIINTGDKNNNSKDVVLKGVLKRKSSNESESDLIDLPCKSRRFTRSVSSNHAMENCEGEDNSLSVHNSSSEHQNIEPSGGICLHVSGQEVSLEFCAQCNLKSCSKFVSTDHSYVQLSRPNK